MYAAVTATTLLNACHDATLNSVAFYVSIFIVVATDNLYSQNNGSKARNTVIKKKAATELT